MLIFRDMVLILLPGFLCDETVWQDQFSALMPKYDCLIRDYGHLDSLSAMAGAVLSQAMAANWIPPMIHPDRRADVALIDRIVQMMERKTPDIFEAQMNALLSRPEAGDLLSRIECPALILTGSHDAWSPPVRHDEMAAVIPNSTLVIVPDCGHMSTMECPDAITEAVQYWLGCHTPFRLRHCSKAIR
jgi:pimeloyl-ACP methyl ester carboxylesterase